MFTFWCCIRVNSRFAPSQWETSLQSNAVSHWLGANLESDLYIIAVIWMCNEKQHTVQVMLRAHELGMTGSDFVWIFYTRHPEESINKEVWATPSHFEPHPLNISESEMWLRREAFYGIKLVLYNPWHQNCIVLSIVSKYHCTIYCIKMVWHYPG